ncbi:hypothetical protein V3I05_00005 [Helicobacter mastomyrinus]|uniref:Uncharacterized protein n=1 Tax=Helicobacter mastomyrinus TaxID=287948 RepID=A0ABZ3F6E9_9HELI
MKSYVQNPLRQFYLDSMPSQIREQRIMMNNTIQIDVRDLPLSRACYQSKKALFRRE